MEIKVQDAILNVVGLLILVTLTMSAAFSDWRLDPVWDFLFARTSGFPYPDVHSSALLAVVFGVGWLTAGKSKSLWKGALAMVGVAGLQEMVWMIGDVVWTGTNTNVAPPYVVIYICAIALCLFTLPNESKNILLTGCALIAYYVGSTALALSFDLFGFHVYFGSTILGSSQTSYFMDYLSNLTEVLGGVVPSVFYAILEVKS